MSISLLNDPKDESIPKSPSDLAVAKYHEFTSHLATNEKGSLVCRKGNVDTGFDPLTLFKAINKALTFSETMYFSTLKCGSKKFMARVIKSNLELIGFGMPFTAASYFAHVVSVFCFNSGMEWAFKFSKQPGKGALEKINNEFTKIQLMNTKANRGMVRAYKFIWLRLDGDYFGYLMEKYCIDYFELNRYIKPSFDLKLLSCRPYKCQVLYYTPPKINLEARLAEFFQLLYILKKTHAHGLAHRDIKLENVLVSGKKHFLSVHLCDWTSCTSKEDIKNEKDTFYHYTKRLTPRYEVDLAHAYTVAQDVMNAMAVMQATDVFAMGNMMFLLLKGNYPYPLVNDYPRFGKHEWLQIPPEVAPPEINEIIQGMIMADFETRLTASTAFERLHTYIKAHHFQLYLNIQTYFS